MRFNRGLQIGRGNNKQVDAIRHIQSSALTKVLYAPNKLASQTFLNQFRGEFGDKRRDIRAFLGHRKTFLCLRLNFDFIRQDIEQLSICRDAYRSACKKGERNLFRIHPENRFLESREICFRISVRVVLATA